jgi:putative oxidoreductase
MKRILFDCGTRDATASFGLLFLRVSTGLMMLIGHGVPKLQAWSERKDGFYVPDFAPFKWMSPPVSLAATLLAEVVAAGLIVLGLATRPAAFVLGFAMVVAAFGVNAQSPLFYAPPHALIAKEPALLYLFPLVAILLAGAGAFSFDASLVKERRRRW